MKTVFNYQEEEIHTFLDLKRVDLEKELRKLNSIIDEEQENEGRYLVFVYYGGRCMISNNKLNTVHGIEA